MRKSLFITTLVILILGILVNFSNLVFGGVEFFFIAMILLAFIPYLALGMLSYWFNSLWITIVSGIIILALDIWLHSEIFVFSPDAQGAIALMFSPIYLLAIVIISFVVLGAINKIIKIVKTRKFFDEKLIITKKKVLLHFVLPVGVFFLYFIMVVAVFFCIPTP